MKYIVTMLLLVASLWAQDPISCQPRVIEAMRLVWQMSGNGQSGNEAGVSLRGVDLIEYADFDASINKRQILVQEDTVAMFHVPPSASDPRPSKKDIEQANKFGVHTYTISN